MKKRLFPLVALFGIVLTSCGGKTWSWETAKSDGDLKYCLLIGQIDHNDSAARTAGVRDALGTRPSTHSTNANTETPVEGSLKIGDTTYKVEEIEHQEMKSTSGSTWDQQTANTTTQTWINKHGQDIDFFVSNNDGMAEGAIGASNWITGTPIFGYDSNSTTLSLINEGKIMGTINQNASAQAAGIYMLTRNAIDKVSAPTEEGFSKASTKGYGQISSTYTYSGTDKSMLVNNFKITKDNVADYLDKSASDLLDTKVTKGTSSKVKVWQSYYNDQDNFLNSNMKPLFQLYKDKFNFDVTEAYGDGNDEKTELDKLDTAQAGNYSAYIINMVKTQNAKDYLDKIYAKDGDVPVIFWNRQPTKTDGTVDTSVVSDSRFTHIYYVGFDAIQGGQLQGEMVVDYLKALK